MTGAEPPQTGEVGAAVAPAPPAVAVASHFYFVVFLDNSPPLFNSAKLQGSMDPHHNAYQATASPTPSQPVAATDGSLDTSFGASAAAALYEEVAQQKLQQCAFRLSFSGGVAGNRVNSLAARVSRARQRHHGDRKVKVHRHGGGDGEWPSGDRAAHTTPATPCGSAGRATALQEAAPTAHATPTSSVGGSPCRTKGPTPVMMCPYEGPPYNLHVEEVKNTKGEIRMYRLIVTSTFSVAISPQTGQLVTKRAAVALVISCLPSYTPLPPVSVESLQEIRGLARQPGNVQGSSPGVTLVGPSKTYCLLLSQVSVVRHMLHVTLAFGLSYVNRYFTAYLQGKDPKGIEQSLLCSGRDAQPRPRPRGESASSDGTFTPDATRNEGPSAVETYYWLKAVLANVESASHTLPSLNSKTENIVPPLMGSEREFLAAVVAQGRADSKGSGDRAAVTTTPNATFAEPNGTHPLSIPRGPGSKTTQPCRTAARVPSSPSLPCSTRPPALSPGNSAASSAPRPEAFPGQNDHGAAVGIYGGATAAFHAGLVGSAPRLGRALGCSAPPCGLMASSGVHHAVGSDRARRISFATGIRAYALPTDCCRGAEAMSGSFTSESSLGLQRRDTGSTASQQGSETDLSISHHHGIAESVQRPGQSAAELVVRALRDVLKYNKEFASCVVAGLLSISDFSAYGLADDGMETDVDDEDTHDESAATEEEPPVTRSDSGIGPVSSGTPQPPLSPQPAPHSRAAEPPMPHVSPPPVEQPLSARKSATSMGMNTAPQASCSVEASQHTPGIEPGTVAALDTTPSPAKATHHDPAAPQESTAPPKQSCGVPLGARLQQRRPPSGKPPPTKQIRSSGILAPQATSGPPCAPEAAQPGKPCVTGDAKPSTVGGTEPTAGVAPGRSRGLPGRVRNDIAENGVVYELSKRLEGRVVLFCTDRDIAQAIMIIAAFFFKRGKTTTPDQYRDAAEAAMYAVLAAMSDSDDACPLRSSTFCAGGEDTENVDDNIFAPPRPSAPKRRSAAAAHLLNVHQHTRSLGAGRTSMGCMPWSALSSAAACFAGRADSCAHPSMPIQWIEENFLPSRVPLLCNPMSADNAVLIIAPRLLLCRRLRLRKTFTSRTAVIERLPFAPGSSSLPTSLQSTPSGAAIVRTDAVARPFRCTVVKDAVIPINASLSQFLVDAVKIESETHGIVPAVEILEEGISIFVSQIRYNRAAAQLNRHLHRRRAGSSGQMSVPSHTKSSHHGAKSSK